MRPKTADTHQLCLLADAARNNNYNRQFSQEFIDRLDPDGFHLVGITLPHEHAQGVKVDPHIRGQWFCKMKDADDPEMAFLDMPLDMFNGLDEWDPEAQEVVPAQNLKYSVADGSIRQSIIEGDQE